MYSKSDQNHVLKMKVLLRKAETIKTKGADM